MSDPEYWRRVEDLCQDALDLGPGERAAFLAAATNGNEALRREVEALLAHENQAEWFLAAPVGALAALVLADQEEESFVGRTVGSYTIESRIGAGGMGEVYRAHDVRLGRHVAVKVLLASFSTNPESMRRFEQEARAAAALNHPNILSVYDIGVEGGAPYIVSELLEGTTVRGALASGPVPLRKAIDYGRQIAAGLAAAHRKGIVHRDVKPENLFITVDEHVKILDFGVAKLSAPGVDAAGSVDAPIPTNPNTLVGTLAYMAPEQLLGHQADARSDVFSWGVVMFEMLTGRPAFLRDTNGTTVAAILSEDPAGLSESNGAIPAAVDHLVRRCLEKKPADRFQSAHDVRLALETASHVGVPNHDQRPKPRPRRRFSAAWAAAAALVLTIAIAAATTWSLRKPSVEPSVMRLSVVAPEGMTAGLGTAISNDGSMLTMVLTDQEGTTRLWLRSLTDGTARPLEGTERAAYPFWSPDDRSIGFFAGGKLRIVAVGGGSPRNVCDAPAGRGGTWVGDTILFAGGTETGLSQVRAEGGPVVQTTTLNAAQSELSHRFPSFMADGRHFVYLTLSKGSGTEGSVMFASIDAPHQPRRLMDSYVAAAWAPDDVLLFVSGGTLWAQQFDRVTQSLVGSQASVAPAIQLPRFFGSPTFSVSRTGVLAYQPSLTSSAELVWRDRRGDLLDTVGLSGDFMNVVLAPDQRSVAVTLRDPQRSRQRLHVFDLARRVLTPIGPDDAASRGAAWSPDSQRIAFTSNLLGRNDLYVTRVSQPAQRELLVKLDAFDVSTDVWSRDGRLVYATSTPVWSLWALSLEDAASATPVGIGAANQFDAKLSPTSRWLTATSEETGRREVMAQTFPDPVKRLQVSANGGQTARWRKDGRELFFIGANRQLMAVDVDERTSHFGVPHPLFDTYTADSGGNPVLYDVSADGQRFLVVRPPPGANVPTTTLIVNWPSLLRQ